MQALGFTTIRTYAEGRFRLRQHGTLRLLCVLFRPAGRKRTHQKPKSVCLRTAYDIPTENQTFSLCKFVQCSTIRLIGTQSCAIVESLNRPNTAGMLLVNARS